MAATAWTNERTLEFIEQYKNKPVLWDIIHIIYGSNKIKRHDALLEIANSFEITKEEVEKKMKNLQTTFSKENKKVKDSLRSGAGRDEIYVSKWYAFQAMMFIQDRNRPRSTVFTEDRPRSSMSSYNVRFTINQTKNLG
uniref:SFRICE_036338 n=1 Tax=Spodoptera frugiperda TaxID=7108 RepID=A0A2H1WPE5_SPOFR